MKSLYDLSLKATCLAIDPPYISNFHPIEFVEELPVVDNLPLPLRLDVCKSLKQMWMKDSLVPINPNKYEYRYLNISALDKYELVMLFNHPNNMYPDFWPSYDGQSEHLYSNYYEFHRINCSVPYVLCRNCFTKISTPSVNRGDSEFEHLEFWESMNWQFFNVVSHCITNPSEFVSSTLKSENSWCDYCVFSPLFKLLHWDKCFEETDAHDSDNLSDYDDDCCEAAFERIPLTDPFLR